MRIAQGGATAVSIVDRLVIEDLAAENAALLADLADVRRDCHIHRDVAVAAIHALHDVTVERDRLRRQVREYRLTSSQHGLPIESTCRPEDHRQQATDRFDLHHPGVEHHRVSVGEPVAHTRVPQRSLVEDAEFTTGVLGDIRVSTSEVLGANQGVSINKVVVGEPRVARKQAATRHLEGQAA